MAECRICSIEKALLTAEEEKEYSNLCEYVTLNQITGQLQAKYPFKKDSGVLIDNGKEAKAWQINQERHQLKTKTHPQYIEQFRDMVNRNVVSEISQSEMDAYITNHEVYKPGSLSTPVCLVSNSLFKNGSTNHNDVTVMGPNTLVDIYDN